MGIIVAVTLAGGAGAWSRFVLTQLLQSFIKDYALWATTLINIIGSFLLGLCYGFYENGQLSDLSLAVLGTGFLGGFTTFSTFSYEALSLYLISRKKGVLFIIVSLMSALVFAKLGINMVI